jgi:hypothetical protein
VPALEVQSAMTFGEGQASWDLVSNLDAYLKVSFDGAVDRETARLKQGVKTEVDRRLRRYGDLLDEELGMALQGLPALLGSLQDELRQAYLALKTFVDEVEKERRKRQQALDEKRMNSMMKLAL